MPVLYLYMQIKALKLMDNIMTKLKGNSMIFMPS
jgi:hypothetical protein